MSLALVQERLDAKESLPPDVDGHLAELTRSIERQTDLTTALRDELLRQRGAVAGDDVAALEASVHAAHDFLLQLDDARRRRDALVATLCGDASMPLDRLGEAIGRTLPAALESGRAALRRAAADVARETAVNRVVLRRAVEAGEAFLQDLFSDGSSATPVYGATDEPRKAGPTGRVLDRTA